MFGYVDLVIFIGVLAAAAMILPSAMNWDHMAFSAQVAQIEAGQLAAVTDGALQYEYANTATLDTPGSSHSVTVAQLIAQGYLPSGTKATDSFGNQISVIFNANATGNVTGYVVDQGPKVYTDKQAGQILLALGDRGGYDPAELLPGQTPNTLYGSGGTWQAGAPSGVAPGSIEVEVEPNAAQQADDSRFLWRVPAPTVAGNTMSTPLIMSAVETPGAGCANTGAIAQDGTGALVSCQAGTWTAVGGGHWRAPVATYAALPGSGNQNGDVRLTVDTDRAFAWNGGSWVALAVNQNGNLHVPGNGDFGGDVNVSGEIGTNGYSPHTGLPPGWGGGIQTWDIAAHGTIGVGPNNSSPAASMNNAGTIENQGVCIDNNSGSCNGWGLSTHYTDGWGMVAQDGSGNLNVAPGSALGSVNVNDIDVRSGGAYPWYSQLSSQVYSDTQQINTLNSEYSSQQGEINGNTSAISSINNNLNQAISTSDCTAAPYASLQSLCSAVATSDAAQIGDPEQCDGHRSASGPQSCGPVGPVTYSYWGYCGSRFYRYRCIQYGTSPPSVNLPTSTAYPQLVVASATAGIGQGGCGVNSNTKQITLSATSGGAPVASESGQYAKGGSNYNPVDMYFPFSITFILPAGQSGQIQLSGGENGLGCGSFSYSLYRL